MTDDLYLKAGRLVMFETGEYSDRSINGLFLAMRDLSRADVVELADAYKAVHEQMTSESDAAFEAWYKHPEPRPDAPTHPPDLQYGFVDHLISKGYLMIVDYDEHHIGSYGELEIE